ncbi:MAG: S9 family peptidase [Chlamydiae bacterium]|nr:S9 family peptidase [Chlamydiota bacterium]
MLALVVGSLVGLDPYLFLEDTEKEETKAFIQEQTQHTSFFLDTLPKRELIKNRLSDILDFAYHGTPVIKKDFAFSLDKPQKSDYKSLFITKKGCKELLIDGRNGQIKNFSPSPNGKYVAYSVSKNCNDQADLFIIDSEKKEKNGEFVSSDLYPWMHSNLVWSNDSKGFWYTKKDLLAPPGEEKLHQKIYYHSLGTDFNLDPLVFGETLLRDDLPNPFISINGSDLLVQVFVGGQNVDYYLDNKLIFKDGEINSYPQIHKDRIYLKNGNEIYATKLDEPHNWRLIFSEKKDIIEKFICVEDSLIIQSLKDVSTQLNVYDLDGNYISPITLPCPGLITEWSANENFLIFGFSSFFIPHIVYQFDTKSTDLTILKEVEFPFSGDEFRIKQYFILAQDEELIPLFMIHKKGVSQSGNNPVLLYGYGGFGASSLPNFNPFAIPFLEHGGIYVIANIRGGGEYGENWHKQGMKQNKQRVFDDFIEVAEWLIKKGYTNPSKLSILGASNGGLLTGAMLTQRPDLFKAIIIGVPVLDMIRFHLFFGGRFWIPEYGSPEDPKDLDYLLKYSPYHNINNNTDYPSTLIFTSDSDDRVHPMHAYKMTAKLNATKTSKKTYLLVEKNAGHGGDPKTTSKIRFYSDIYSFIFHELDIK